MSALSIGEICIREVTVAERDMPLNEAARLMRDNHVGTLVVVEDRGDARAPIGILTDRDIVLRVLSAEVPNADSLLVGDLLTGGVITVQEDMDLLDVLRKMRHHGIRRAPVVDRGGLLIGIVAFDDLLEVVAEQLNELVQLLRREQQNESERAGSRPTGA